LRIEHSLVESPTSRLRSPLLLAQSADRLGCGSYSTTLDLDGGRTNSAGDWENYVRVRKEWIAKNRKNK